MGPLYGMLSVAGWAFFAGLLGYVITMSRRERRRQQGAGFEGVVKDDRPKES